MRCGMIKPDRQNTLGNCRIAKFLPAAIRQDHEVELDSDGHDPAGPCEVRHIYRVHRATQQDQRAGIETVLSGKHGHAATVTVGQQVGILNGVPSEPTLKLRSGDGAGRLAIIPDHEKASALAYRSGRMPFNK